MGTFSLQLDAFVRKTKGDANQVVRKATLSVLSSVVKRSPVDTGRFRGAWVTNLGVPSGSTATPLDPTGASAISSGLSVVSGVKAGDTVWITNSLPYARRLEDGYSQQAPAGMVRLTVQEWNKYIRSAIAAVA